jgi:Flp pilus assembly protein TadD
VALSKLELAEGHPDSSINFAEQALQNAPRSLDAKLALVRGLVARRDVRRSEAELQPLLTQYPDNPEVLTLAGAVARLKGEDTRAARLFANAVGVQEGNFEAQAALISLDLAAKKPADATKRVEALVAKVPKHPAALLLAARTYVAVGDSKKAEYTLRKTIEVDAANIRAYELLGQLYLSQHRLTDALKEFDELARHQPRPVQAHTLAGTILEMQNNPSGARKRYEQALEVDPDAPVAANNLAWMMAETGGNLDVALRLAQTAARGLPDHPAVQDTLGWIYYKKDLGTLAVSAFQKSVEKDPKNPLFHFHLGLAHAKVGDSPKARLALQQALALAPTFAQASEAKQVLNSLRG